MENENGKLIAFLFFNVFGLFFRMRMRINFEVQDQILFLFLNDIMIHLYFHPIFIHKSNVHCTRFSHTPLDW